MPHFEPDTPDPAPSYGCLVALSLSGTVVLALTGLYWLLTSL